METKDGKLRTFADFPPWSWVFGWFDSLSASDQDALGAKSPQTKGGPGTVDNQFLFKEWEAAGSPEVENRG